MVAIKCIEKERVQNKLKWIREQIALIMSLDHPNIITYFETYESDATIFIVMEHCSGGNLIDRLVEMGKGNYTEKDTQTIMKKLL